MSETMEEILKGQFEQRRKDFLRDMELEELQDLFPGTSYLMELLIEEIINQSYDKDILPEEL